MSATILQFPLVEGACCLVESRRNPHRERREPVAGCLCDACEQRREELHLASKIAEELVKALREKDAQTRVTAQLERDAG